MHAAGWVVWAACAGVVAVTTSDPVYLVPLAACAYVVHAVHHSERSNAPAFKVFFTFALVTIAVRTSLSVFGGSLLLAFLEGLKLGVLLIVFGAFNSVADPYSLLRLAPRRFHEPALAASLALSITPRTIAAAAQVREAQKLRGIELKRWRSLPALAVPVLETGMEEALILAESMDARGHGRGRRSRYRPEPWTAPAIAFACVALLAALFFLRGTLEQASAFFGASDPIGSGSVTGLLVVLTFALPALLKPGT